MLQPKNDTNHYDTLHVHHRAAQAEIKRAYRNLVKQFHPDCNHHISSHDRIAAINNAYEVLSNPQSRAFYDRSIGLERLTPQIPQNHRPQRQTYADEDRKLDSWSRHVYEPIVQLVRDILEPLNEQIDGLAADPFDDELLEIFQNYLEECRDSFTRAQTIFRSIPNPASAASVAAHLYHCLNQLGDGIEELNYFTLNFDDRHLHTGQELWRIAEELYYFAQEAMQKRQCIF